MPLSCSPFLQDRHVNGCESSLQERRCLKQVTFNPWEAAGLGNRLKTENSHKCLGEGAKGLLDPGSKGLRKVFCATQNCFCTGAKWGCTCARGFVLPGSKRPFAPSLKRFWEFAFFGQFPRPAASQYNPETECTKIAHRRSLENPNLLTL